MAAPNATSSVHVQLPSHVQPAAPIASSSPFESEANESSVTYVSALEAAHQVDVPAQMELPTTVTETSADPPRKGKGVGKRLTDRQRVEILELVEKSGGSLSNAEIARRYGITRAAIQKLKQKGAEVRARYRYGSAQSRDERRRGGHILSVPFERELFEWVRGLKSRKVPVPPSLVKEKAKLLVPKYGLGNFQASNGWYYNFCKRFNLSTGVLIEERVAGDDSNLNADQDQLQEMQQTYEQIQQFQNQQVAAITAAALQPEQQREEVNQDRSDRMLALLEQQNALLERQNSMVEEQTEMIKKLFAVVNQRGTTL
ncbi:Major centromere autoantigen B [Phytophthora citrophthora]|uniref:Major centromere autoantigen B n=1 Tax=Phytophthora citrophthora TaxID=4793 RepID=A0AAD9GPY3_9STRA|nr:Major centromere autoantigen B [Phytophthora citrophthora]